MSRFDSAVVLLVWSMLGATAVAQPRARIVEQKVIWQQANFNKLTDLVRFQGRWYCVFCESATSNLARAQLRVIASRDGLHWTSVAQLAAAPPNRGNLDPRLVARRTGRLCVVFTGSRRGQSVRPMAWQTKNGSKWVKKYLEPTGYRVTSVKYHKKTGYAFSYGSICGSAQTVQIRAGKERFKFQNHFKQTFRGFSPGGGALAFTGDKGFCLMSRGGRPGYLGLAKAPYTYWNWIPLQMSFRNPNVIRTSHGELLATVTQLRSKKTVLCQVDVTNGVLHELLALPAREEQHVGLVAHQGFVWISFHAHGADARVRVHIAKLKVQ